MKSFELDWYFTKVKTLKDNHAWFVDTVSCFKPPNENSRAALNSQQVKIGSHQLNIKPELKDKALKISSYLVSLYCCFYATFTSKMCVHLLYIYTYISDFQIN